MHEGTTKGLRVYKLAVNTEPKVSSISHTGYSNKIRQERVTKQKTSQNSARAQTLDYWSFRQAC